MHVAQSLQGRTEIERTLEGGLVLIRVDAVEPPDALKLRRQQAIDQLKGEAPGDEAHILVAIGIHHIVDAELSPHGASLAAGDAGTDEGLKFQGDMLGHMSEPSPLLQAPHEAATFMEAAAMLAQARQHGQETLGERSEEHTSELQSRQYLVCRLLLEKKKR